MFSKDKGCIRILHLSDLHVKEADKELLDEIVALEDDIKGNFAEFDFIVITGDLTYSGKNSQFDVIAHKVIPRLRSVAKVAPKSIIIVPGNHDVDRDMVSETFRIAIRNIKTSKDADQCVSDIINSPGFGPYRKFIAETNILRQSETINGFCRYATRIARTFCGKIHFACFNTAWCCLEDCSKGNIFLTKRQIDFTEEKDNETNIRMAIMHHGLDWLHEDEYPIAERLNSSYDLIFTGHVHREASVFQTTPKGQTLVLTGACFSGDDSAKYFGYNIYDVNPVDGNVKVYYRKYIADDCRFAENVDYVPHGVATLQFKTVVPMSADARSQAIAFSYLPRVENSKIVEQLKRTQGLDRPIYIPPILDAVTLKDGEECRNTIQIDELLNKDTVLFAPKDYGKTLFLEKLTLDIPESIYVDCSDIVRLGCSAEEYFRNVVSKKIGENRLDGLVVLIDHLCLDNSSELAELRTLLSRNGNAKSIVVSTSSEFLFSSALRNKATSRFSKVKIRAWGVDTIEAFARKFWAEKRPGQEPRIDYLKTSLAHSDIPITPVIIGVYVSLFAMTSVNASSASLVNLIERLAEITFGADKYNNMDVLMNLACKFHKEKDDKISSDEMRRLIAEYYDSKNLDYKVELVFRRLIDSRFIIEDSHGFVTFSYYIFRDYFVALAMFRRKLDVKSLTSSDSMVMSNTSPLVLYGSIARDDENVIEGLLDRLLSVCGNNVGEDFDFKQLDGFISFLFLPPGKSVDEEQQLVEAKRKNINQYKMLQEEFERNRQRHKEFREKEASFREEEVIATESYIDKVIVLLGTFYNLYRNLENISGEMKEGYLDLILDFHVYCNLMLIQTFKELAVDKELSTLIAYIVTIGGQSFLRHELLSPSLRKTIIKGIKKESNDFKKFLLISLYADGMFDGYEDLLQEFLSETNSYSAIEMLYFKVRHLLITHRERTIPDKLLGLFKNVVEKRNLIFRKKVNNISQEVDGVKRSHMENYQWGDKSLDYA